LHLFSIFPIKTPRALAVIAPVVIAPLGFLIVKTLAHVL